MRPAKSVSAARITFKIHQVLIIKTKNLGVIVFDNKYDPQNHFSPNLQPAELFFPENVALKCF